MADTNALLGTILKTYPGIYYGWSNATRTLDDLNEALCVVFQSPADCDITGMRIYCAAATSSPDYKFTLEGVTSVSLPGEPDGSAKAETAGFTPSVGIISESFASPYTATEGEVLAGVLRYESGTISGSNDANFVYGTNTVQYQAMPYTMYHGTSSWATNANAWPALAIQTDEDFDAGGILNSGKGTTAITSSGHRMCQRVLIPADEDLELHINGFSYIGKVETVAGATFKAGIWNAAGAELASVSIASYQQESALTTGYTTRDYTFTQDATVQAGTVAYIGYEHTGANLTIQYQQPLSTDGLRSWPGGAAFYASTWNGSAWSDDITKRLCLNPMISSMHGTAAASGSTTRPTMGIMG